MRFILVISLFLPLLFVSCGNDGVDVSDEASLNGRWLLVEARKNNAPTGVVDGLFFTFNPDGSLETNLMGNEQPGAYTRTGNTIATEGVKLPMDFNIQELTDSSLHVRSEFRGYQFDFLLAKDGGE